MAEIGSTSNKYCPSNCPEARRRKVCRHGARESTCGRLLCHPGEQEQDSKRVKEASVQNKHLFRNALLLLNNDVSDRDLCNIAENQRSHDRVHFGAPLRSRHAGLHVANFQRPRVPIQNVSSHKKRLATATTQWVCKARDARARKGLARGPERGAPQTRSRIHRSSCTCLTARTGPVQHHGPWIRVSETCGAGPAA